MGKNAGGDGFKVGDRVDFYASREYTGNSAFKPTKGALLIAKNLPKGFNYSGTIVEAGGLNHFGIVDGIDIGDKLKCSVEVESVEGVKKGDVLNYHNENGVTIVLMNDSPLDGSIARVKGEEKGLCSMVITGWKGVEYMEDLFTPQFGNDYIRIQIDGKEVGQRRVVRGKSYPTLKEKRMLIFGKHKEVVAVKPKGTLPPDKQYRRIMKELVKYYKGEEYNNEGIDFLLKEHPDFEGIDKGLLDGLNEVRNIEKKILGDAYLLSPEMFGVVHEAIVKSYSSKKKQQMKQQRLKELGELFVDYLTSVKQQGIRFSQIVCAGFGEDAELNYLIELDQGNLLNMLNPLYELIGKLNIESLDNIVNRIKRYRHDMGV